MAQSAKNRAFRCKSSELPMQFLWAFRYNPIAPNEISPDTRFSGSQPGKEKVEKPAAFSQIILYRYSRRSLHRCA
ncbi:MAG: hypothetical protein LBK44_00385 [Spirochaetales bacterium]|nr:hypothetical protein [Spirochaetales bacterium]